jgi:hypothetical protein
MLFTMFRRFVIMAVAVPLAAAGARKLSEKIEARRGSSRGTRLLRRAADAARGLRRPKKRRRFAFR